MITNLSKLCNSSTSLPCIFCDHQFSNMYKLSIQWLSQSKRVLYSDWDTSLGFKILEPIFCHYLQYRQWTGWSRCMESNSQPACGCLFIYISQGILKIKIKGIEVFNKWGIWKKICKTVLGSTASKSLFLWETLLHIFEDDEPKKREHHDLNRCTQLFLYIDCDFSCNFLVTCVSGSCIFSTQGFTLVCLCSNLV